MEKTLLALLFTISSIVIFIVFAFLFLSTQAAFLMKLIHI